MSSCTKSITPTVTMARTHLLAAFTEAFGAYGVNRATLTDAIHMAGWLRCFFGRGEADTVLAELEAVAALLLAFAAEVRS